MKKQLTKLLTSKRFWVCIAGIISETAGVIPPGIALKLTGAAVAATKIIDIIGEQEIIEPK